MGNRMEYRDLVEILKGKGHLEDLDVDGRIVLIMNWLYGVHWIYLTHDWDHSQAHVSMVINLEILHRAGQIDGTTGKLSGAPPKHVKALTRITML
jgi:hypothetical protein